MNYETKFNAACANVDFSTTGARVLFRDMVVRAERDTTFKARFDAWLSAPTTLALFNLVDEFGSRDNLSFANATYAIDTVALHML